jgi:fructose-bisphosphate aldolase class II
MTIISIKTEMERAAKQHFAIPLYDVFDQYAVDGVFNAVEDRRAPVILGIYSGASIMSHIAAFTAYIRARAERSCMPISIMLDHGATVEQCLHVLECGFTDVMYDGSSLPFEENIANTRRVVQAAHAYGAAVEAELGHVGSGSEYDLFVGKRGGFTDPDRVEQFVTETGVDFLAIAFGNAHGLYKGNPQIDLELVREVHRRVDIPLVMHGGTGLTDEMYAPIIDAGIAKINFFTGISQDATRRMIEAANQPNPSMLTIADQIPRAYFDVCCKYFDIFRTSGKANCN